MGHSPAVDIFVPVHPKHFGSVERCVESIRQHLQPTGGRICIVTAALPGDLRQRLDKLDCTYLHESDVVAAAPEKLLPQFLKWELRRFSNTPTYLVVDAEEFFSEATDLHQDGKQILFCENRFRFGQLMCFNYFFGQIPFPTSPASGNVAHFDCAVLNEMLAKIEGRWKVPWITATLAILAQVEGTAFDAADAFGHYLNIFRAGSFVVRPMPDRQRIVAKPGIVRMATLGHNGRFANQIFQYAFLRLYAEQHGLQAECPPWIGCSLFGHQPTISENALPIYREDKGETDEMIRLDPNRTHKNFELWGYFQDPKHWARDPQQFRRLFEPLPFLKQPLDEAINRLRRPGQTLVAIHLRRGDFNGGPVFWPAPEAWYLHWLAQIWPTLNNPVLYVATDDPENVLLHFKNYQPRTAADLKRHHQRR